MKSALCLTIILSAACLSWAATQKYKEMVSAAISTCAKKYNFEYKQLYDILKSENFPHTKFETCVAGCFLDEIDYVTDHYSFDWGKFKALNPEKYKSADLVNKANHVADVCSKAVPGKFSDLCVLGEKVMKCYNTEAEKVHLPKPDV